MGLTKSSVGTAAIDTGLLINKESENDYVIALAGNPNVGKSTVFNALTGLNQHTGNWPGKTVANAMGRCSSEKNSYILVDIPGTYSLLAHSAEEEIARNFICFGNVDAIVVVCDATCLERNLNLVLQTLEISDRVVVCVNLMDEAKRKGIEIDINKLSELLGVEAVGVTAHKKKTLNALLDALDKTVKAPRRERMRITYPSVLESAISAAEQKIAVKCHGNLSARWIGLRLIEGENALTDEIKRQCGDDIISEPEITSALNFASELLRGQGIGQGDIKNIVVSSIIKKAESIADAVQKRRNDGYHGADKKLDRIFTGKFTAFPIMLLLLGFIFWLTMEGANYPSQLLSRGLFFIQYRLADFFELIGIPAMLNSLLTDGAFRVLAWVVSVMLPPMAIFFPLFTLLEDAGYLPRVAYNLDKPLKKCNACGKQALTICMGFGCNAAGIVGCRIIDSPRERLLAILTNNFVPCNGRFPTLIALITMFFASALSGGISALISVLLLMALILLGILSTFFVTYILSKTVLKGVPSSFTLELPPYRRPQIGRILVRSVFDRTIFVLGRAAAVAAPAGVLIWFMANISIGGETILKICSDFLDPFARLMGLDGVILMAFILGFPANEIVIPIIIMAYTACGSLTDISDLIALRVLFADNGWTWVTAACTMIFSLMHWPCSTALLTIKKETGSLLWTAAAFLIPTAMGMACCMLLDFAAGFFI